jgi:hypothetical protein
MKQSNTVTLKLLNNGCTIEGTVGRAGGTHVSVQFLDSSGVVISGRYYNVAPGSSPAATLKGTMDAFKNLVELTHYEDIHTPRIQKFAAHALLQKFNGLVAA